MTYELCKKIHITYDNFKMTQIIHAKFRKIWLAPIVLPPTNIYKIDKYFSW